MKVISLDEANLKECVRDAQRKRLVLTRKGKPVSLLVSVQGLDLEQIALGHPDDFWELIRQRRARKTMSREELQTRLTEQK